MTENQPYIKEISIVSWNINGWTNTNQDLRKAVINKLDPDIVCLVETHLSKEATIEIEGYKWFPHNRLEKNKNAPFTHGGVGILVKDYLLKNFNIMYLC